jgi:glycosyltransferase involved in cell wall biosynthesis
VKKRVFAVVPAYNEENTIGMIVKNVRLYTDAVFVVDDCSSDETSKVAQKKGAIVIRKKVNVGGGKATQSGLHKAYDRGADIVFILDADGQHSPKFIPLLLAELNRNIDYVIGSRYIKPTTYSTSWIRRFGTGMISSLIHIFYGRYIHDPTSGFRAMNKRTLQYLSSHYPATFSEPEIIIDLIKKGFAISEVSVEMKPRLYGSSSISLQKAISLMGYITKKIIIDWMSGFIQTRKRVDN